MIFFKIVKIGFKVVRKTSIGLLIAGGLADYPYTRRSIMRSIFITQELRNVAPGRRNQEGRAF